MLERPPYNRNGDPLFSQAHPFGMTQREDQVLRLMAKGCADKETAGILGLSTRTVEIHRGHAIEKLHAKNTAHAIAIGFASGLLTAADLKD